MSGGDATSLQVAWRRRRLASLALLALLVMPSGKANAEPSAAGVAAASKASDLTPALRQAIESQARQLLERHLPPESFQLFVTVTPKTPTAKPLPYLPDSLPLSALGSLAPEDLAPYLAKVQIEVVLAARYKAATQAQIKTILTKKLLLDPARGDSVTFSKLALELPETKTELELSLQRAEADGRDLKRNLDTASREREDLKREMDRLKADLAVAQREAQASKEKGTNEDREKDKDEAQKSETPHGFVEANLVVLCAALLILVALMAVSFTVRGPLKLLSQAVRSIGDGLPVLGEKLAEARSGAANQPIQSVGTDRTLTAPQEATPSADVTSQLSALPLEALQARILTLHEELIKIFQELGPKAEAVTLRHVSQLIGDGKVGPATCTLEMIGKALANALYQKLGASQQRQILTFLRSGHLDRPKVELMVTAGEELKTKILLEDAVANPRQNLSDRVSGLLLQFTAEDLVTFVLDAPLDLLPRFFLYLPAAGLASVLNALYAEQRRRFTEVSEVMVNLPAAEQAAAVDGELEKHLTSHIKRAQDETHRPYLDLYKTLVESVEEAASDGLQKTLAAGSPLIERYLRDHIINFSLFFRLDPGVQEEILDGMGNRDLAAIIAGLSPDLDDKFKALLDARRRELVEDEVTSLSARGARQVETASKQAKRELVQRIIKAKGDGPITAILAVTTNNNDAGAAGVPRLAA